MKTNTIKGDLWCPRCRLCQAETKVIVKGALQQEALITIGTPLKENVISETRCLACGQTFNICLIARNGKIARIAQEW